MDTWAHAGRELKADINRTRSGRREMEGDGSGNARRNGNNCAPFPIWNDAKGKYRQASL